MKDSPLSQPTLSPSIEAELDACFISVSLSGLGRETKRKARAETVSTGVLVSEKDRVEVRGCGQKHKQKVDQKDPFPPGGLSGFCFPRF